MAIRARACYEAATLALATVLRDDFVQVYERDLPAAVRCFLDDFDACTAHLRFPLRHRKVIRTTNFWSACSARSGAGRRSCPMPLASGRF